jgi:uncharacterized protein YndB with AHSA1/START domain
MVRIEETTVVARPLGDVFRFVADQENAPRWQKGLVRVTRSTDGPVGVGTTHTFERKMMGRLATASNVYTKYLPDEVVAFEATSGPLAFQGMYLTAPAVSGTQVTCRMDLTGGRGLTKFFLPLIARTIRKEMRANFITLKRLLDDPQTDLLPPPAGQ